ncbi:MAG: pyridoxal phosphate-dependent aminotransferase [Rhodobacteraceae bacterium]|nr:pyridoxal phosphate-dependent aminotransferase [Paracoccaceae bacterium]MCY4249390.1 pyridoxal phosphate-dependent aminotransferase [Paracoccaceae bacterium]
MQINQNISSVRVSGTVKLAQRAKDMIAEGKNVIDLTEGQPHYNTPTHIIEAAYNGALEGKTGYTAVAGTPHLRKLIANHINKQNETDYQLDNIVVGCGGKQLIFNALMVSLEQGDEVIIPAPYWVSYPEIVKIARGTPVPVQCPETTGFKMTAQKLESTITKNTRWLILNSPGNPTGTVYTRFELEEIAAILREHEQVAVLCDDIYEAIIYDGAEFNSLTKVAPDLISRTLTVSGLSKSHAMTGWRIGYCAGESDFIGQMIKLQGQSTTNASSLSQVGAVAALEGSREFLKDWLHDYTRARDLVCGKLSQSPYLDIYKPEGAFYLFVGCRKLFGAGELSDDKDVCNYLLENAHVAVIPGSEFGSQGYFRLCFAKQEKLLDRAIDNILQVISDLSH